MNRREAKKILSAKARIGDTGMNKAPPIFSAAWKSLALGHKQLNPDWRLWCRWLSSYAEHLGDYQDATRNADL